MNHFWILLALLCSLLSGSCSQQETSTSLKISSQFAISSAGFTGGLVVTANNGISTTVHAATTVKEIKIGLTPGDWKFNVVGWDGTTPFSGNVYCGSTSQNLSGTSATVSIDVTASNCTLPDFLPGGGASLKPLKIYTCKELLGSDLQAITSSSTASTYTSGWCDNNAGLTSSQNHTARGMRISVSSANTMIESACLPTNMDPLATGKIPLAGIPFTVKLYDLPDCSIQGGSYEFPKGISSGLNSSAVMNTNDTGFNSLFLAYQYASVFPLTVTINQNSAQLDPVTVFPVTFDVSFSHPVNDSSFSLEDVIQSGTAPGVTWTMVNSGNNRNYTLIATSATDRGTIYPTIGAGMVLDSYGLSNGASTSTDANVTYNLPLSVTVNQGISQSDPANTLGVSFDVVFSHAITPGTFAVSDILNIGTATGVIWTISTSDNISFIITATTATTSGTIIPTIPALAVIDAWNVTNLASTSTDNNVTYVKPLLVTINQGAAQADPTTTSPVVFDVSFSAPIDSASFTASDITNSGTSVVSSWTITPFGNGKDFTLSASVTASGTIIPSLPAGTVQDLYSFFNQASTSTDATVTYKVPIATSPASHSFGNIPQGIASFGTKFVITNSTGISLNACSAPVLSNSVDFDVYENTCTTTLASGSSCHVIVRGMPSTLGAKTTTLSMECTEAIASTTINGVTVTGDHGLGWTAPASSFGKVLINKKSNVMPFHYRNLSNVSASSCGPVSLVNGTEFSITSDDCLSSTHSGLSACTVYVRLNSGSATGTFSDSLQRNCSGLNITYPISASRESILPEELDVGGNTSCLKLNDGTVRCWGFGNWGQITDSNSGRSSKFSPFNTTLTSIAELYVGDHHSCALTPDISSTNTAKCWGHGSNGELGNGTTASQQTVPQTVSSLSGIKQLALGKNFACALMLTNSTVKCWGENLSGQFGNGSTAGSSVPVAAAQNADFTNATFDEITAGTDSVCGRNAGTVSCWGGNSFGQLGDGTFTSKSRPVTISLGGTAVALSSGAGFHCALLSTGEVKCWGLNNKGQLGNGGLTNSTSPVFVSGITGATELSQGDGGVAQHMCALVSGSIKCWGHNYSGQLGNNSIADAVTTPVSVSGLINVVSISRGIAHTCALNTSSEVACWGSNQHGQLGKGLDKSLLPVQVSSLSSIKDVIVGDHFTCANDDTAGSVYCWGQNKNNNQLGLGVASDKFVPTIVPGLSFVSGLTSAGDFNSSIVCAKTATSHHCWGKSFNTPTLMSELEGAVSFGGGNGHWCGIYSDNTSKCAGSNGYGQLGTGSLTPTSSTTHLTVTQVAGGISKITGGFGNTYAIQTSDNTVWSWGYGVNGQLGDGTTANSVFGTKVSGLANVTQVLGVYTSACAVHDSGKVSCWGAGTQNLGIPSPSDKSIPERVSSLDNVSSLAAGNRNVCALRAGRVWCWGYSDKGLGNGTTAASPTPIAVLNLDNVQSLWKGDGAGTHACAIKTNKTLWCWGIPDIYHPNGLNTSIQYVNGYAP